MTLKELATLANVSQSTVSKAFSDAKDVSQETKEYIFKIAKEHHCYEKFHKGNYFKKIVAVICPEIKSEAYYRLVTHLETLLANEGATMVLSLSHFDSDTEKALFYYHAHYQKVDGIIIIASGAKLKDDSSVPTVRIGTRQEEITNSLAFSKKNATEDAIKHLIDMGHHRIAYIGEHLAAPKLDRFLDALRKWHLPIRDEYIVISNERFEAGGYQCMEQLLALPKPPTAIIAAYDYMALGAMGCITDHGLSVPDDISIIGQDNIRLLPFIKPALTSIDIPYQKQGELAVNLLLKKMKNKYYTESQDNRLGETLIIRDSVKNLKEVD